MDRTNDKDYNHKVTMHSETRHKFLFTKQEIEAAVKRLSTEIRRDYFGKCPILLSILKDSVMLMADLIRQLDSPLEVEFIRLST